MWITNGGLAFNSGVNREWAAALKKPTVEQPANEIVPNKN
jgi:hypothetical protein